MVRANREVVDAELARRGWTEKNLIPAMNCAENTVRNLLAGDNVSARTQVALYDAFERQVPIAQLFQVVLGDEDAQPQAAEGAVA